MADDDFCDPGGGLRPDETTLALLAGLLFFVAPVSTSLVLLVWPGEILLVAPLFCSDAQPDAFLVIDTVQVQPGETTTNNTLYCMGPRGDASNKGWLKPSVALAVLNSIVVAALFLTYIGATRQWDRL